MESVQSWRDVYQALTEDIRKAQFKPGSKLPSQAVLARRYNGSRHAVRRALRALSEAGVISCWQGRAAVLLSRSVIYQIGHRTRLASGLRARGHFVELRMSQTHAARRMPSQIAKLMDMPKMTCAPFAEFVHHVDGIPTALGRHYFNDQLCPNILNDATADDLSVPEAFYRNGVTDYFRAATYVEVRLPTAHEALSLDIPPSQSVLCLLGQNVDAEGRPIEVTEAVVRSDTVKLQIEPRQVSDLV